jgi:hypothetical protein
VVLRIVESYRAKLSADNKRVTDKAAIELMFTNAGMPKSKFRQEVPRMAKRISATRRKLGKPLHPWESKKPPGEKTSI